MTRHSLSNVSSWRKLSKLFVIAIVTAWYSLGATAFADTRQIYTGQTYRWLNAVGKLEVPGQRYRDGRTSHYTEDCSATLVGDANRQSSNTIITAWHCLEFYSDLSKPIAFILQPNSAAPILREAYQLVNGGGMHADWAILRLYTSVSVQQVKPLRVEIERANPEVAITMAGYSRDEGIGAGGQHLSFDPACLITRQESTTSDTNCTAYKGSSGGAAIQISGDGIPQIYGVISQGNGAGLSTFVPAQTFSNPLRQHLK